jgi:hypothetical protein
LPQRREGDRTEITTLFLWESVVDGLVGATGERDGATARADVDRSLA